MFLQGYSTYSVSVFESYCREGATVALIIVLYCCGLVEISVICIEGWMHFPLSFLLTGIVVFDISNLDWKIISSICLSV
jgi:hypothetical protein